MEVWVKAKLVGITILAAALVAPFLAAQTDPVNGTWSGGWTPKGGVRDAVTVELRLDSTAVLKGKFLTPVPMEFSNATYSPKTGSVVLEANDPKSGKHYKVDGRITGTELKGTLMAGDVTGELLLIKWTFSPR
jgi:hypothetical protein